MNIARHTVRVADLVSPETRELLAPLTEAVEYVPASVCKRISHVNKSMIWRQDSGVEGPEIVLFEIINSPTTHRFVHRVLHIHSFMERSRSHRLLNHFFPGQF